jgi:hypothetical protein
MSRIVKQSRNFSTIQTMQTVTKTVKNPEYEENKEIRAQINGFLGGKQPKYITIYEDVLVTVKTSRVAYLIKCVQCNVQFWVKREDAKYCSGRCRKKASEQRKAAALALEAEQEQETEIQPEKPSL